MTAFQGKSGLDLDHELLESTISGTITGLQMADVVPRPVGASCLVSARHTLSILVGMVGRHSGNMALNLSEVAVLYLAGRLLGEPQREINEDSIDAIMEIGNMVAGAIKKPLRSSGYEIEQVSLPSLIMGQSYNMVYARGIRSISVEFDLPDLPFNSMTNRFFTTSVSLLRGSGS
ncbi:MAG TPA: chemotaxis protein CheX [Polyangiaceae bacterium]|nr:chemotaxis protein CheX [Polyangiaceae bacterium]